MYYRTGRSIKGPDGVKDYGSVNKAKKASRKLQAEGAEVTVIPHKVKQFFPRNMVMRKPSDPLCKRKKFIDACLDTKLPLEKLFRMAAWRLLLLDIIRKHA